MAELLAAHVGNNTVYIEAEPIYGFEQTTSFDQVSEQAGDALAHARETITSIAMNMAGALADLEYQPEECLLEFAMKFNTQGSAIVARTNAEAHLKITMTYKRANEI